ncbi:hypothetical protein VNO77_38906 [Canavalia gladiata]|uniref:Uncharacterized protein n=1 Tax=Canavalia gladiata TaxID=3824 RepID=A0AAN9KBQ1_CANGL
MLEEIRVLIFNIITTNKLKLARHISHLPPIQQSQLEKLIKESNKWTATWSVIQSEHSAEYSEHSAEHSAEYSEHSAEHNAEYNAEHILSVKHYGSTSSTFRVEVAESVKEDFGSIDILVHSLANGPKVTKPLLETSRKGYLAALSASSGSSISLTYIALERIILGSAKAALESDTRVSFNLSAPENSPFHQALIMRIMETDMCSSKCAQRCAKAGMKDRCMRFCGICCNKCKCVPFGTYGNQHECPCYRDSKNSKGRPKCP